MASEVAGFTPEPDIHNSKLSRTRCIIMCVTLITLLGVCVAIALVFTYATDPPSLIVVPDTFIDLEMSSRQNYMDIMNSFVDSRSGSDRNYIHCSYDRRAQHGEECYFNMMWAMKDVCNPDNEWGYRYGNPCVLLVLNEPKNWVPEVYTSAYELPDEMPISLREHIQAAFTHHREEVSFLWVTCEGVNPADNEYLGEVTLMPWQGIPIYYFPIREETTPSAIPVLSLSIKNPEPAVLINIRCYFWAKNLKPPYIAANFQLLV